MHKASPSREQRSRRTSALTHHNGTGIRSVCQHFMVLRGELDLFSQAIVAVEGSKFKARQGKAMRLAAGGGLSPFHAALQLRKPHDVIDVL